MVYHPETKRHHRRIVKENHISFTSEPDGQYRFVPNQVDNDKYLQILRFHFKPAPGDRKNKPAKMAALSLHEWMVKHGVDQTVLVLGGDSTNENTGWQGYIKI